jgi:hypothetical protein
VAFFLRLAKKSVWTSELPVTPERRTAGRQTFERRAVDTDGVSLFEVTECDHVSLVIAAIASGRENLDPVDVLPIPNDLLHEFGTTSVVMGDTPIPAGNNLHRCLEWEGDALTALADRLLDLGQAAFRFAKKDIRIALRDLPLEEISDTGTREFVRRERAG